jgi:hypothetical protein
VLKQPASNSHDRAVSIAYESQVEDWDFLRVLLLLFLLKEECRHERVASGPLMMADLRAVATSKEVKRKRTRTLTVGQVRQSWTRSETSNVERLAGADAGCSEK